MTTTTFPFALESIAERIRRTAKLYRDDLDVLAEHFLDTAADHLPAFADHARDCLAAAAAQVVAGLEPTQHAEYLLDHDPLRAIAERMVELSSVTHHPERLDEEAIS